MSGNDQSGQSGTWAGYGERAKTARAIGDPPAQSEGQMSAAFAPTQPELRQLLIAKLRVLANDLDTSTLGKKYPNAGEVKQRVARLGDIAGALE